MNPNFDERTVSFLFQTADDGVQLAAFSDDGVSVTITDLDTGEVSNPLSNYNQGQALPNLSQSLKLVPTSFIPGHSYSVETHYLNTLYTGAGDIDGLKFFAFAGDAIAAAKPKLIADPQWSINSQSSGPVEGAKVFPGQEVVFQIAINEADSVIDTATGRPIIDPRTGQPIRVPFSGSTIAKLKVENATFADGGTTLDVTMSGPFDLRFQNVARIRIPAGWDGTQKVKVSYTIEDPGFIPEAQRRIVSPDSNVKDTTLSGTWSWSRGDTNAVPETVTGKRQKHLVWPGGPLKDSDLYSQQQTRQTVILYAYGPDRNGANTAGNYTGLTVTELFGPVSTNLDQTKLDWIQDEFRPAAGTVDDAFNAFLKKNADAIMTATFVIAPLGPESDATMDAYGLRLPEICLVDFLKPAYRNKAVTVSWEQNYECPPTKKLKGDMPRLLKSSADGVGAGTPPVPLNPRQQIAAPGAAP